MLDRYDVEAIADVVVERLQSRPQVRLVDAAGLAEVLGVERDWVYRHADRLGAIRLGGPGGRLRFDQEAVLRHLQPPPPTAPRAPRRGRRRRARGPLREGLELIEYES